MIFYIEQVESVLGQTLVKGDEYEEYMNDSRRKDILLINLV